MAASGDDDTRAALALLERCGGLLLAADARLPSVSTLVAGEPVRGSWWGHPRGHDVYRVLGALANHPDIAVCKLVGGKVTLVHRDLWPALVAVGSQRAAWQTDGLSTGAAALLDLVDGAGRLRADDTEARAATAPQRPAAVARELEARLLVHAMQLHSESGKHVRKLTRWDVWSHDRRVGELPAAARGRVSLEAAVGRLGGDADLLLPWRRAATVRGGPPAPRQEIACSAHVT